ncbi:hypothetical protein B296_00036904 [Ensete ventricosum]|uniref:Uncharacterized protein n=1 Tax=Ensete ventricosum TaxID=4639 RepID=A0A426Y3D2_ENSVE|nr:hypothetical protein B296_00036904 [Ensete ventricosum]
MHVLDCPPLLLDVTPKSQTYCQRDSKRNSLISQKKKKKKKKKHRKLSVQMDNLLGFVAQEWLKTMVLWGKEFVKTKSGV